MELQWKHIAILWFGKEGKSSLRWLLQQWISAAYITVLDKKDVQGDIDLIVTEAADATETDSSSVQLIAWPAYLHWLDAYDVIFRAPGITTHMIEQETGTLSKKVKAALTSQTQVFFDIFAGKIIWITGTKGKSTTSTFLYEMLKAAGKDVVLAGNVGRPVLDQIDFSHPPEIVVYEMSSYMVEALHTFTCDIGILTTLIPVHIKEHGDYETYVAAKMKLLEHSAYGLVGYQAEEELHNLGKRNGLLSSLRETGGYLDIYGKHGTYTFEDGHFCEEGRKLFSDEGMQLLGMHNRYNLCAAVAVCEHFGVPFEILQQTLQEFKGLEHRLEYVGMYWGIKRYNDAIATSPLATQAAIESFGEELDTLFLGGIEGTYDFTGVVELLEKYHVHNLVLFPDTWERIKWLLDTAHYKIFETRSMADAVQRAAQVTEQGKVALLSCGSPSFSVWSGFEEKGRLFKEAVKEVA